jgi:hypothetical protein
MASDLYSHVLLFSLVYNEKFWKPSPAPFLSFLPLFTGTATFVSEDPTGSYAINSSLRLPEPGHRRVTQAVVLTGWRAQCNDTEHEHLIYGQKDEIIWHIITITVSSLTDL